MMSILIEAAIRSAALALCAWLLLAILRIRDLRAEKLLWTAVVAASLAMPVSMRAVALPPHATVTLNLTPSGAAGTLPGGGSSILAAALMAAYLSISALLLMRFVMQLRAAAGLYRRARPVAGYGEGLAVRISDEIRTPCTLGRTVLLPEQFEHWDESSRPAALAHERAHVAQLDCYRLWLACLHCCLFWFSPVAWLMRRRLVLLAELTSDAQALECVADAERYTQMLVRLAAAARPISAALAMSGSSQLPKRIRFIMESDMARSHSSAGRKVVLNSTAGVVAILCIGCVTRPYVLTSADDWKVSWVGGASLGDFYPSTQRRLGVTGAAVVKLAIDRDGQVTDASLVSETPAGAGFGPAAIKAAHTFHFKNTLAKAVIKTTKVQFALTD